MLCLRKARLACFTVTFGSLPCVWLPSFFLAVLSAASSGRDDGGVSTGAAKARAR